MRAPMNDKGIIVHCIQVLEYDMSLQLSLIWTQDI